MSPETQSPQWMWYFIGLYFFVGGVSAGAYFLGSLIELFGNPASERQRVISRTAYYIAFPLILIAPVLLIGDLGQPLRFWHLMLRADSKLPILNLQSPMSVGSWALLVYGAMAFASFYDNLVADGRVRFAPLAGLYNRIPRKIYAAVGSVAGFFVAGYTGVLLNITARPFWAATDPLVGFLFMASAGSTGAAAVYIALTLRRLAARRRVQAGAAGAAAAPVLAADLEPFEHYDRLLKFVELGLAVAIVVVAGSYAAPLLRGPLALMFWLGAVGLGTVLPIAINWFGNRPGGRTVLAPWLALLMGLLVLLGGALLRISIVQAGQL
ncbi:MAG TPA: NrfD/PsrC family molybdoenzyme membrane anchor subunit [Anaerolineae bacterium]